MASRATKPRVSVSEGIMKMSALAYAADSSSPRSMPCNAAGGSSVARMNCSAVIWSQAMEMGLQLTMLQQ